MDDALAPLSVAKLKRILAAKGVDYSSVVEKQHLRDLVKENVSLLSELETLLQSAPAATNKKTFETKSSATGGTPSSNSQPATSSASAAKAPDLEGMCKQAEQLRNTSPDTLRYQAKCMRNDPDAVRRMHPEMASFSDAELRANADRMEQFANNPALLQQYVEQMRKMTPEMLRQRQEQMNNMSAEGKQAMQDFMHTVGVNGAMGLEMLETITAEQVQKMLKALTHNPSIAMHFLKQASPGMTGNLSADTVRQQVSMLSQINPASLAMIMRCFGKSRKRCAPCIKVFVSVDKLLCGKLKYLGLLLVLILVAVAFYLAYCVLAWFWWTLFGTTAAPTVLESATLDRTAQGSDPSMELRPPRRTDLFDDDNVFDEYDEL